MVNIFLSSFLECCATRGNRTHRPEKRKPPLKSTSKSSRDKTKVDQDIWNQQPSDNTKIATAGQTSTSASSATKTSASDVSLRRSVTVAFDGVVRRRLSNVVRKSLSLNLKRVPVTIECDAATIESDDVTTPATSARNER